MPILRALVPPPARNIAHVSRDVHFPPPPHGNSGFLTKCIKISGDDFFGVSFDETAENNLFSHVLLELSFVIVVTRILRFLLKPLHQPRIVSEILVSISPSGFFQLILCFCGLTPCGDTGNSRKRNND